MDALLFQILFFLIAQDADDLEFILKILNNAYREWGLTINFNKQLVKN